MFNEWMLENCGDTPVSKNRKMLDESVNIASRNRGFHKIQYAVAIYEQTTN